jgi:hypothetical protein
MPSLESIPQGGRAFVGSMPWDSDPAPPKKECYLKEHEERMHALNLIQQGDGAFVGSIPRAPDPAPPIKLM